MLSVPSQSEENAVGDYDAHEGYDPRRRDEEDVKPEKKQSAKAEEPKPEPKKSGH
jgi:hypothetical protein